MNTNGGLRHRTWWQDLAGILNQSRDYVVFSIDGLADTNHIYRRGVVWDKVMENAQAFIDAGGSAHWDMLVYQHNQHQVDQAQALAKKMGFTWFRAKISKRPLVNGLAHPDQWQPVEQLTGSIKCYALSDHSIYIDARGVLNPCCWLGNTKIHNELDFDAIQQSWQSNPHPICRKTCSSKNNSTIFSSQWQLEVQL
jgi:sulfatase maturation enzyme AslB (radical SAM superfamily)